MTILGIFNYSKKIGKYNINFVRIDDHFGWWGEIGRENHGDYMINNSNEEVTDKIYKEIFHILERQVKDTIRELKKKKHA